MGSQPNMCVAQPPAPKGDQMVIYEMPASVSSQIASGARTGESIQRGVKSANNIAKIGSSQLAFRRFNWLKFEPVRNVSGNLRGMVINRRMRTIFDFTKAAGSKILIVGAVISVAKEMERFEKIYATDHSGMEKFGRALSVGGAAILRDALAAVPTVANIATKAASMSGELYADLTGDADGDAFAAKMDAYNAKIDIGWNRAFDGEQWYNVIEATLE